MAQYHPFLRPFRPEDEAKMLEILINASIRKTYMLPDYPAKEDAIPLFRRLLELSMNPSHYVRCIAVDEAPIGFLNNVEIDGTRIEVGYVIHPDHQNRGYMTAALRLAMEELASLGFEEILAGAFQENTASIRVMEKCAMTKTDKTETIIYRGLTHNCVYYTRILNEDNI